MGYLDDAFKNAVPGGNIAKPLMIAAGLLLASKMFGGSKPAPAPVPAPAQDDDEAGGLIGGLGGLIDRFKNAGHGDVVDSWVGAGQNKPLQPAQLETAVGKTTISDLARQAGVSEQELLSQLSMVLPDLVDKLTPNGRMPTAQEIRGGYRR